jgi:hypothetical protein
MAVSREIVASRGPGLEGGFTERLVRYGLGCGVEKRLEPQRARRYTGEKLTGNPERSS